MRGLGGGGEGREKGHIRCVCVNVCVCELCARVHVHVQLAVYVCMYVRINSFFSQPCSRDNTACNTKANHLMIMQLSTWVLYLMTYPQHLKRNIYTDELICAFTTVHTTITT